MRKSTIFALLALSILLGSCGSSSDDSAPGDNTNGSDNNSPGPNGAGSTTDTTANGDGSGNTAGAGLSHVGSPVPTAPAIANDPQISEFGRTRAAALPNDLGIMFEVIENHGTGTDGECKTLSAEYASCSVINIHIKDAAAVLNDGNWRLYFHSIRRILRVDSDEFGVVLVNGDLNYIEPTAGFTGFSGDVKTLKLITEFAHLIETDFMPRYWLVQDGQPAVLISNTDSETDENAYAVDITGDNRRQFDNEPNPLATASTRHSANSPIATIAAELNATAIQTRIVPKPTAMSVATGVLQIDAGFSFMNTGLTSAEATALTTRQAQFMSTNGVVPLQASIDSTLAIDAYTLIVNANGISITAGGQESLFNGAQSLLGLVQPGIGSLAYVTINDSPRFSHRGIHLDVARNFHSMTTVKKLLDQMAAYKLNKLHMHLSDDEGWRLAIGALPELTSVGAKREFQLDTAGNVTEASALMPQLGSGPNANNQGTGHYSRAEFVDLLKYAAARHISVIPEFDMPAHARAAVVAMRARAANLGTPTDINVRLDDPADTSRYLTVQHFNDGILNPCIAGTYSFIDAVITEVASMYSDAGVALSVWHMGGDEAKNVFKGPGFQDITDGEKINWKGDVDTTASDYPWEASPACATFISNTAGVNSRADLTPYFVKRVSETVANAGIPTMYAYQDIYGDLTPADLTTTHAGVGFWEVVYSGGFNHANDFSNRGFETILMAPDFLFFDFPYEVDPKDRGFYWATRFNDTRKVFAFAPENLPQNAETSVNREGRAWSATGDVANLGFHGMQAQLWSETVRTPQHVDYMLFPRLLALAERAWHRAEWELDYVPGELFSGESGNMTNKVDKQALAADYAGFAAALGQKELKKLDAAGVQYRIPVPGGVMSGSQVEMNVGLPGLPMEYSTDGNNWQLWSAANKPVTAQAVRARSADSSRAGRAISLP